MSLGLCFWQRESARNNFGFVSLFPRESSKDGLVMYVGPIDALMRRIDCLVVTDTSRREEDLGKLW